VENWEDVRTRSDRPAQPQAKASWATPPFGSKAPAAWTQGPGDGDARQARPSRSYREGDGGRYRDGDGGRYRDGDVARYREGDGARYRDGDGTRWRDGDGARWRGRGREWSHERAQTRTIDALMPEIFAAPSLEALEGVIIRNARDFNHDHVAASIARLASLMGAETGADQSVGRPREGPARKRELAQAQRLLSGLCSALLRCGVGLGAACWVGGARRSRLDGPRTRSSCGAWLHAS
jgi:hypothetical protein